MDYFCNSDRYCCGNFILGIYRGEPLFDMLILSVAVSVGAVPEALLIALTVILSIGAERIAKNKVSHGHSLRLRRSVPRVLL